MWPAPVSKENQHSGPKILTSIPCTLNLSNYIFSVFNKPVEFPGHTGSLHTPSFSQFVLSLSICHLFPAPNQWYVQVPHLCVEKESRPQNSPLILLLWSPCHLPSYSEIHKGDRGSKTKHNAIFWPQGGNSLKFTIIYLYYGGETYWGEQNLSSPVSWFCNLLVLTLGNSSLLFDQSSQVINEDNSNIKRAGL